MRSFRAGGSDLENVRALAEEAWRPQRAPDANFHVGDLCWGSRYPEYEQTPWLREDEVGGLLRFVEWSAPVCSSRYRLIPIISAKGWRAPRY